jgi:hypothetical protein
MYGIQIISGVLAYSIIVRITGVYMADNAGGKAGVIIE